MWKKQIRFCDIIEIPLLIIAIILQLVLFYKNGHSPLNATIIVIMLCNLFVTAIWLGSRIIKNKRFQNEEYPKNSKS